MKAKNKNALHIWGNVLAYFVLTLACILVLIPFATILSTSFKSLSDAQTLPFKFVPDEISFDAYIAIIGNKRVWRGLVNTLIVVVPVMFIGVFISSLAAYAFAKLNFKGKNILFALLLGSMMLPGVITMTPAYVLYDTIGWTNSWLPLMVPGLFGTASCIFFMRNYIARIPAELMDAGKVDGLSHFGIFCRVILPIIKPAFVAQVILWFFTGYNDYFGPMLYLDSQNMYTLQLVLNNIASQADANQPEIMATCVFSLIPALIIYVIAQKSLLKGISMQGVRR